MDAPTVVSIVVGAVSVVMAGVAIWISTQAEKKSTANYNATKDLLREIGTKAAVIEQAVSETQSKLVDTVTAIAKPREETQDEMLQRTLIPKIFENPELLQLLLKLGGQNKE